MGGWGDAEAARLAGVIASGALASLKVLNLNNNQIGDAGCTALAKVCTGGALPSLKTLYMNNGPLGTEHPALKAACQARGIALK